MAATGGVLVLVLVLLQLSTCSFAWDVNGHSIICNLARPLLTAATAARVNNLLNSQFPHNFSTLCTWAEEVQYLPQYSWSPPLHYVNTPDQLCSYDFNRDCVGIFGEPDFCASGAIKNYTSQLLDPTSPYNQTEALLFLSNIIGDIHQPLRVGFVGDGGGSFIHVWWLNTLNGSSTDLFSVWDSRITHEAYERYYNQSNPTFNETLVDILGNMSLAIYSTLTATDVETWSQCPTGSASCPDIYATESIKMACQWAYAGVTANQILSVDYFNTRYPIVQQRLLQSGVRVAATLNRIFDATYKSPPLASPPAATVPPPELSPVPQIAPSISPVLPPTAAPTVSPVAPPSSVPSISPVPPPPLPSVPSISPVPPPPSAPSPSLEGMLLLAPPPSTGAD